MWSRNGIAVFPAADVDLSSTNTFGYLTLRQPMPLACLFQPRNRYPRSLFDFRYFVCTHRTLPNIVAAETLLRDPKKKIVPISETYFYNRPVHTVLALRMIYR